MGKIKYFLESDTGKDILIVIIIILIGLGSFELGRLSKNTPSELKIEYFDPNMQEMNFLQSINKNSILNQNIINPSLKKYFASSRGSKYYSISCSTGKTIKQENRIYFATKEAAENAGYELSSACN